MNVIKEREIDALATPWVNARVVHLLSMEDQTTEGVNPNGYDEVVFTRSTETIEAFSSWVISIKMGKAYTGKYIYVMTQVLQTEDGSLPQGLPSKMHTLCCGKVANMLSSW